MGSTDRKGYPPPYLWGETCFPRFIDFVFVFLAFASLLTLICTGSIVMKEYLASQHYRPTRCSYLREHDHGVKPCTYCWMTKRIAGGSDKAKVERCVPSQFPCIQIEVEYKDAEGIKRIGNLYEYRAPKHNKKDVQLRLCMNTCAGREDYNDKEVKKFASSWRTIQAPSTATCYYNSRDTKEVITVKEYTYQQALHSVLWPTLFFFLALIFLIGRCCFRYHKILKAHEEELERRESVNDRLHSKREINRHEYDAGCQHGVNSPPANQFKQETQV